MNKIMSESKITHYGSTTRIAGLPCNFLTKHAMRVEMMLYPFKHPNKDTRTEDSALCLTVGTDTEYSEGHAILLSKNDVAAIIGILATHLAKMTDE